jgi:hypothetical protein
MRVFTRLVVPVAWSALVLAACSSGSGGDGGSSFSMTMQEAGGAGIVLDFDGGPDEGGAPPANGGGTHDAGPVDAAPEAGPTAFNPDVTIPSHDCRRDTSVNCISYAGTYNGVAIDGFCNSADGTSVIVHAGQWVIGCDDTNPGFARLYVPIAMPGPIAETDTPDASAPMAFEFSADTTTSDALFTNNLVGASLLGTIAAPNSSERIVSGTFYVQWSTPNSSCEGTYGSLCAEANLNVTFREDSMYGTCFSDSDCPSGETCDSVASYCHD